jgi:hypothetical protein
MFIVALYSVLLALDPLSNQARAAEDCRAAPNSQTPKGQHWYYRRDQVQRRNCWFLGPEDYKKAQVASHASVAPKAQAADHRPIQQSQKLPSTQPSSMQSGPVELDRHHDTQIRLALRQKFEEFLALAGERAVKVASRQEREQLFQELSRTIAAADDSKQLVIR